MGKLRGNRKPPPEGHRWKPGESGNPKGRPPNIIPKALRDLSVDSFRNVIEAVCAGNMDSLESMIKDPNISALQVGVARSFLKALGNGDYAIIERIVERIVGKIPDELNIHSKNLNANFNASIDSDKVKAALAKLESEI